MSRARPEPTAKEIAAWRRLVKEARACANNPARPTGDLFARTCTTAKCAAPTGREERANPWFQLRDTAIQFCARRGERGSLAPELKDRADACAALIAEEPTPAPRRFRADVDG